MLAGCERQEKLLMATWDGVCVCVFAHVFLLLEIQWKWKSLSCVQLFATPWTVHGTLQARILEWVAFPFSRVSSQPRYQTQVSHIAGGFFTSWVTREAPEYWRWVAYPFSSGSSPSRSLAGVSCIAGEFPTNWASREALWEQREKQKNNQQNLRKIEIRLRLRLKKFLNVSKH